MTEGTLKEASQKIKILFLNQETIRAYFNDNLYEVTPDIVINKSIRYKNLDAFINEFKPDLALINLPVKFDSLKNNHFHLQTLHFVSQSIDVTGSWEEIKSGFGKSRKTFSNQVEKKYGFSYRISREEKDLKFFYHHMYLPYISQRFNDEYLMLDSYENMKHYFNNGFLLFIIHEGKEVLASLTVEEGDSLTYRRVGILDKPSIDTSRAQMAMYYYLIKLAKDKGFSYMNAMESLAFFNDGIYQSKWRWGAGIYNNDYTDSTPYYLILDDGSKSSEFFELSPTIINKEGCLFGLLGRQSIHDLTETDIKSLRKSYYAKNLEGMQLFNRNKETKEVLFSD